MSKTFCTNSSLMCLHHRTIPWRQFRFTNLLSFGISRNTGITWQPPHISTFRKKFHHHISKISEEQSRRQLCVQRSRAAEHQELRLTSAWILFSVWNNLVETKWTRSLELLLIVIFQIEHEKVTQKRRIHWERCNAIGFESTSLSCWNWIYCFKSAVNE